jgi:hypothetical protein
MAFWRVSLIVLLSGFLAFGQASHVTKWAQTAQSVFIENGTGDSSVLDSAHLALASSDLRWKDDRKSADLVFHFERNVQPSGRTVRDDKIHVTAKNTYTLDVTDRVGTVLWKASVDFDPSNVRAENTERAWLEYLHQHPANALVNMFLKVRAE